MHARQHVRARTTCLHVAHVHQHRVARTPHPTPTPPPPLTHQPTRAHTHTHKQAHEPSQHTRTRDRGRMLAGKPSAARTLLRCDWHVPNLSGTTRYRLKFCGAVRGGAKAGALNGRGLSQGGRPGQAPTDSKAGEPRRPTRAGWVAAPCHAQQAGVCRPAERAGPGHQQAPLSAWRTAMAFATRTILAENF